MISRRSIFAVSVAVFVVGFICAKVVLRTTGPHTWHRAYIALVELEMFVDSYENEYGEYPAENKVNAWIGLIWANEGDIQGIPRDEEFQSFTDHYSNNFFHRLKRWEKPPRYIVSDSIPDGRGFYIVGDDGVTSSSGNDPDDINSWNSDSSLYYHKRSWRKRYMLYAAIGLIAAIPTAIFLIIHRFKQKVAQHVAPQSMSSFAARNSWWF